MHLDSMQLDLDAGTLTLTDADGRSATYHQAGVASDVSTVHAIWDGPKTGGFARTALIDADTFPPELVIKHRSPGPNPQPPYPVKMEWSSHFRYVRDDN